MKNPIRLIKGFLWRHGLYSYASRKYRHLHRFTFKRDALEVQFHTDDEYSNSWFFPRFAGGKKGHEHKVTDLILDSLGGSQCFLDVGANLGWFTCIVAKHLPQGQVYGFEMDGSNFAVLQRNVALNACGNAQVFHQAVAESSGTRYYDRPAARPSPMYQLASGGGATGKSMVAVETIALDDFCARTGVKPDVIKIDVEGAEMNVLRGMQRLLAEVRPVIFMELHPYHLPKFQTSAAEVVKFLTDRRYELSEVVKMRDFGSATDLKPITADSVLTKNTMLYARPA